MATEVEELIQEQAMTNLNLEILSENTEIFQNLLGEVALSNKYNERNLNALINLDKNITNIFDVEKTSKLFGDWISLESDIARHNIAEVNDENIIDSLGDQQTVSNFSGLEENAPVVVREEQKENVPEENTETKLIESFQFLGGLFVETTAMHRELIEVIKGQGHAQSENFGQLIDINNQGLMIEEEAKEETENKAEVVDRNQLGEGNAEVGNEIENMISLMGVKAMSVLGPLAIPALIASSTYQLVTGMLDVFDDPKMLEDITGKAVADLSASEKTFAGISNGISKLTFGFFDAKEVFETIEPMVGLFEDVVDGLFDPQTGLLSGFTNTFIGIFEGDAMAAVKGLGELIEQIPSAIFGILDGIGNFLLEQMPAAFSDGIKDFPIKLYEFFDRGMTTVLSDLTLGLFSAEEIAETMKAITEPINVFFSETIPTFFDETFVDPVIDAFGFITEIPAKIGETFSTFVDDIVGGLNDEIKSVVKGLDLPFGLGDKLIALGDSIDSRSNLNVPKAKSPDVGASKTADLSKQRLDDSNGNVTVEAPAPIIIQPQPVLPKTIERKTESGDMKLAMAGMGN